jgi:hypothetical protein
MKCCLFIIKKRLAAYMGKLKNSANELNRYRESGKTIGGRFQGYLQCASVTDCRVGFRPKLTATRWKRL